MGSQRVGYDWPTKLKTFSTSQNTHSEPHCTEDAINFPDKSYQAWALLPHPFSHLHMCFLWSSSFPLVTVSKAVISLLQGTSKPLESIGGFHLHLQLVLLYISMSIHHKCVSLLLGHFSRVRLCGPIDGSPPGSAVPGILQARTLEWVTISFSNAWKWKVKGKSLSRVRLFATPWTAAYQAPPPMGFSRQEYWSGVPDLTKNQMPHKLFFIEYAVVFYIDSG